MLTDLLVKGHIEVSEALIYALVGFVFVFIGIGVLIGILYLVGLIMQKTNGKKLTLFMKKKEEPQPALSQVKEEEIPESVKAAIVAAIMAYYQTERPQCEFVVRKIKRI